MLLASRRRRILARLVLYSAPLTLLAGGWWYCLRMPGRSHGPDLPPPTPAESALEAELRTSVETLAGEIGPRNLSNYENLEKAATWLEARFEAAGHDVRRHVYTVRDREFRNLEVEIRGTERPDEIVVVGAHYDTCYGPGADDNASGTAGLVALAARFAGRLPARTLRFVAFVNEEPPFFQSADMGSYVYARDCRERGEDVVAMLSLEMLGTFSDEPDSQRYPSWLYELALPSTGNFIGFVGDPSSRALVHEAISVFREHATIPSEGAVLPQRVVGVSDHWSFWQVGYPAIMVTNTAYFRNAHYHETGDTPETLDYARMARVVRGLEPVIASLAGVDGPATERSGGDVARTDH